MGLVARLKEKQEPALRELMEIYGDELLRSAYLFVRDRYLAEEVVQDAFVIAFEKIEQLEDDKKLKGWLITIMYNQCRSYFRSRKLKEIPLLYQHFHLKNEQAKELPEAQLLELIRNEELSSALQRLSHKYRDVLILYFYHELKLQEIAELMNLNLNTVKARMVRGKLLLKTLLEKEEQHEQRVEKRN